LTWSPARVDNRAVPKTLLAVDDSVTMRKVVEMTFAGEDLRVVTAATSHEALAICRGTGPDVILLDVSLEGESGYDLCRSIKSEFGKIPVVLLASKQNPYDPARAQASGADDHLDKPYDTAKAIELIKRVLEKGQSVAPAPIAAAPIASAPPAPRAPIFTPATPPVAPALAASGSSPPHPTLHGMAVARPPAPALQRQVTVKMPSEPPAGGYPYPVPQMPPVVAPPVQAAPAENPALKRQETPALRPQSTLKMTSDAPPASEIAPQSRANGGQVALPPDLGAKLGEIGLTEVQVQAVLALSHEVVERVVWEVVPVLAETIIREEIARLTRA
jgi:CheY-like chemotaxis protein